MKILLISNMYPSTDSPNFGVFVKNTEIILRENGHQIDKVVMQKETNKRKKMINYLLYYIKILTSIFSQNYDYIYVHYASHNALPILFSRFFIRDMKVVANVHGSDIVPVTKVQQKLQGLVKKLLAISEKIIVPSPFFKNKVTEKYSLSQDKVFIYPSGGVNKDVFRPIEEKHAVYSALDLDPAYKYIGYVGRIDYKKGWDTLLQAVNLLSDEGNLHDKKVILVGNGSEYPALQKKITDLNMSEHIILYPFLPQEKLGLLYNVFEIFCFPTQLEESLGLVGLEAMACGTPVIGSSIGGLKDYLKHNQNGLLFNPGESEDLKEKINLYFSYSKDKIREMSDLSIATAEEYTPEKTMEDLLTIFK